MQALQKDNKILPEHLIESLKPENFITPQNIMKSAQNLNKAGSVHGTDGIPNEFWTLFASKQHKLKDSEGNETMVDNPLACLLSDAFLAIESIEPSINGSQKKHQQRNARNNGNLSSSVTNLTLYN